MCDSFDEGYGSDGRRSPIDQEKKQIQNDSQMFKEKYRIDKLLSNSANGIIYTGVRKSDGARCVAKQVPRGKIGAYVEHDGRKIPLEFHLHLVATANGIPGMVEAWECYERQTSWVIVMEKPKHSTDLFEVLAEMGKLQEQAASIILAQVIETSIKLEEAGIFHRDIKDENILLDVTTLKTKLIDFGCGDFHRSHQTYDKFSGTIQFAPPEVHLGPYKASPVTVWSIGALAYTMLVGDVPYETRDEVVTGQCKNHKWRDGLSVEAVDFISACMRSNPAQRPKLSALAGHALIEQL